MRVVLDTNVLISAMWDEESNPALLVQMWRDRRFQMITGSDQIEELQRISRYPKIKDRLTRPTVGRMVNDLLGVAVMVDRPVVVDLSRDAADNKIIGIALSGGADFLVTGDKRDLLSLDHVDGVKIITVRDFLHMLK